MKHLFTFFITLFVASSVWAQITWDEDYDDIFLDYNGYGTKDQYGQSIQWQTRGNTNILKSTYSSLTGKETWQPVKGEKLVFSMDGVCDFTGTVKVFLVDTREEADFWADLTAGLSVGEVQVTAEEPFQLQVTFDITNTKYKRDSEGNYTIPVNGGLVPSLVLTYEWAGTSIDDDFDTSPMYIYYTSMDINISYAGEGENFYFESNKIKYKIINETDVQVISNSISGSVEIPSEVNFGQTKYTVTSIGEKAFSGCTGMTSITIPESVTSIGNWAFAGCTGLTSITIPGSVTSIGENAFSDCTGLTSITILEGVTSIGNWAFDGCTGLTSITIPESVTSIGNWAFDGCADLASITLPESLNVQNYDGQGHYRLYIYIIKDGIRYHVLNGKEVELVSNSYSGNIVVPSSVTAGNTFRVSIGEDAFRGCTGLTTVTISEGVTRIREFTFSGCTKLTSIFLPSTIEYIGSNAFSGCTRLAEITCLAPITPSAKEISFTNYNGYLYVTCDFLKNYKADPIFGLFKNIECIPAEVTELENDEVAVEPQINDALFSMPTNAKAKSYSLTISNNDVVFCTLTFNENGQLAGIDFNSLQLKSDVAGFQFKVTGLSATTNYAYVFQSKDINNKVIKEYIGTFSTKNEDRTGGSSSSDTGKIDDEESITISVTANNSAFGSVMGAGSYDKNATAMLIAIPASGYQFTQWNDGNTDNPRTITVSANASFVATFEKIVGGEGTNATITLVSSNNSYGMVVGAGTYDLGATATLIAVPSKGCQFVQWNDGNTENPRYVTVSETMFLVATFEKISAAVETIDVANEITISNHQIFINGEAPKFVITCLGQKIANQNLKAGVYIIVHNNNAIKVILQ